jgi:hypothetical protein
LYWGDLSIFENQDVKQAMEGVGTQLRKVEHGESPSTLQQRSYKLAIACRKSLKKTWEPAPVDTFDENENDPNFGPTPIK